MVERAAEPKSGIWCKGDAQIVFIATASHIFLQVAEINQFSDDKVFQSLHGATVAKSVANIKGF